MTEDIKIFLGELLDKLLDCSCRGHLGHLPCVKTTQRDVLFHTGETNPDPDGLSVETGFNIELKSDVKSLKSHFFQVSIRFTFQPLDLSG